MSLSLEEVPARALDRRRLAVAQSATAVGLDGATAERQGSGYFTLRLTFVPSASAKPAIPPGITAGNVLIRRLDDAEAGLRVESVRYPPAGGDTLTVGLRLLGPSPEGRGPAAGEIYRLRLEGIANVDPLFAEVQFTLRGKLAPGPARTLPELGEPPFGPIDYLAKDYASFRRLMLDRMTRTVPTWLGRNPVDFGIAVIEALAYSADYLSYYQDAVATEAYLATARRRLSVRRHARLLDYTLSDGLNARLWVHVIVSDGGPVRLPRGTRLLTRAGHLPTVLTPTELERTRSRLTRAQVFETLAAAELRPEHNRIGLYAWGMPDLLLPAGATSATLRGQLPDLAQGDVLLLQEGVEGAELASGDRRATRSAHPVRLCRDPILGVDPLYGVAVTEIAWYEEDALPLPLPIATAVALGNAVPADHGETFTAELPPVPREGEYSPDLPPDLTVCTAYRSDLARQQPAARALTQEQALALPAVVLHQQREETCRPWAEAGAGAGAPDAVWVPRRDLFASGPFSRELVAEIGDGAARLRFGDGRLGARPSAGSRFQAVYRLGGGTAGNVGVGAVRHLVTADPQLIPRVLAVSNPVEGQGGTAPEPSAVAVLMAPQAIREQRRCVTPADFVAAAKLLGGDEVLAARAEVRFTGSWLTVFLYVERRGGRPVPGAFARHLRAAFEPLLLAGQDLDVRGPAYLPLEIVLAVTLDPRTFRESARAALAAAFGTRALPGQAAGFFDPDRFTFGQPLYLSEVIACAAGVPGVVQVDAKRFARYGETAGEKGDPELATGRIVPGPYEIVRVESQPGAPELGSMSFRLEGGQ